MDTTTDNLEDGRFNANSDQKLQLCHYYQEHIDQLNQEFSMSAPRSAYLQAWEDFAIYARRLVMK